VSVGDLRFKDHIQKSKIVIEKKEITKRMQQDTVSERLSVEIKKEAFVFAGASYPDSPGVNYYDCYGLANFVTISNHALMQYTDRLPIFGPSLYVLEGWGGGKSHIWYIGESKEPIQRLLSHRETRSWWNKAYVAYSETGRIGIQHAKAVEGPLISNAQASGLTIDNSKAPYFECVGDHDIAVSKKLLSELCDFLRFFSDGGSDLSGGYYSVNEFDPEGDHTLLRRKRARGTMGRSSRIKPSEVQNYISASTEVDVANEIVKLVRAAFDRAQPISPHGKNAVFTCVKPGTALSKMSQNDISALTTKLVDIGVLSKEKYWTVHSGKKGFKWGSKRTITLLVREERLAAGSVTESMLS